MNPFRFDENFASAHSVVKRADHLRKQGKLGEDDLSRVAIIEGLGAIATVLSYAGSQIPQNVVACSLQAAEAAQKRAQAAYDIVDAIVTVADAQLQPLLAQAPKFEVPKRSSGGAASLGFGGPSREEKAVAEAAPLVVAYLDLVEFALNAGSFFPADKPSGKFFAALFAKKPVQADDVESTVESAFHASEK